MNKFNYLRAYLDKKERDLTVYWPAGEGTKSDGRIVLDVFNKKFTDDLAARGYDISTLKFSIKPKIGNQKFDSQRTNDK